uniref:Uncharacterized protein n=1 Tax=Varanus komodoensis TaxID=61221 RepID=A0A8D2JFL9_VARKO
SQKQKVNDNHTLFIHTLHFLPSSGTSNWAEEYFSITAGVGLIAAQSSTDTQKRNSLIQEQLRSLFERDWNSKYSVNMEELPGQKDCAWQHGFTTLKEY